MYIDAKQEDFYVSDAALVVSLEGILPDVHKDSIYIAPASLNSLLAGVRTERFYIAPVELETGAYFCVRTARGEFTFTENFESLIRNLTLTVCSVVKKCGRQFRKVFRKVYERAKNTVRPTVPCFLRL